MSTLEPDFDAALRDHDLIGNPSRALEFFALVAAPRTKSPVTAKIKKSKNGLLVAVALYSLASIIGGLAVASIVDPVVSGFVSLGLFIAGTIVISVTERSAKSVAMDDLVAGVESLDPDVAIDAGWLDELPLDVIETLDAQARWDAVTFMVKITDEGIPEVGTDYDDPTFEERFSDARREQTIAMLKKRR